MSPIALILLGCCAVLLLDAAGAALARRLRFRYTLLAPLSFLLYAAFAWFAANEGGLWLIGSVAGAAMGATDATFGWRISRALGMDPEQGVTEQQEAAVATMVTVIGAVIGTIAGLVA